MKVGLSHCIIISVVFSLIGYFIFQATNLNGQTPLVVSASLLISGIVTPWLASLFNSTSSSASSSSSSSSPASHSGETATLYVGNLPYRANEDAVKEYFQKDLHVQSVRLMKDRKTGKRKGYGFVEVITGDVEGAIQKFNDSVFQDRTLKVRPAKDKASEA